MRYVPNRRYVVDRGVITTTGVAASLPVSIALVEAIAGRERAEEVARAVGVSSWGLEHDSAAFKLDARMTWAGLSNIAAPWSKETFGIDIEDGIDELSLSFTSDSWSRTFRSQALTVSATAAPVVTRRGLRVVPDLLANDARKLSRLPSPTSIDPARSLDHALASIDERYGDATADFVALQLELDRRTTSNID